MSAPGINIAEATDSEAEVTGEDSKSSTDRTTRSLKSRLRKNRFWLIIGTVFLLVVAFALYQSFSGSTRSNVKLSISNPAPDGAMAVGQILGAHGVNVVATDNLADTEANISRLGAANTSVVLFDPDNFLLAEQARKLVAAGARVIAITPGPLKLQAMNPELVSAGAGDPHAADSNQLVNAGCHNPDAEAAQKIAPGFSRLYSGPVVCFTTNDGTDKPAGMMAQSSDGKFTVLGSQSFLSNDKLAAEGNAALALRLLGHDANLVWYLPSAKDLASGSGSKPQLSDLQPAWLAPVGLWLAAVGVLATLWKGRRDGPLVEEPLPVVVKAAETAAGRARLYQDGKATERAADNLRSATLGRLARRYRLGAGSSREAIVLATIRHTNIPETEIRRILLQTVPSTEGQLLTWSQQLESLERETERDQQK